MRIFLRVIAVVIAMAVVLTALMIVQFTFTGGLDDLVRFGVLGFGTIAGWLITLTAGPIAAVQLWRLRRVGLALAVMLCAIALAYSSCASCFFEHLEHRCGRPSKPSRSTGLFSLCCCRRRLDGVCPENLTRPDAGFA